MQIGSIPPALLMEDWTQLPSQNQQLIKFFEEHKSISFLYLSEADKRFSYCAAIHYSGITRGVGPTYVLTLADGTSIKLGGFRFVGPYFIGTKRGGTIQLKRPDINPIGQVKLKAEFRALNDKQKDTFWEHHGFQKSVLNTIDPVTKQITPIAHPTLTSEHIRTIFQTVNRSSLTREVTFDIYWDGYQEIAEKVG
jgi:hypothetical protein